MDTTDPDITFDAQGVCNHCHTFLAQQRTGETPLDFHTLVKDIKRSGKDKRYDCVLGVSGGTDSSFTAYMAKDAGLRPLIVHLDNGWNTEIAVRNIENVCAKLGLDLFTHVIDWNEFRDLQLAFLRASVIDIELLTDQAIVAMTYRQAKRNQVRYVLTGHNSATESSLPAAWVHAKSDVRNIKAIHKQFGTVKMKTYPTENTLQLRYWKRTRGIREIHVLDHIDYDKGVAEDILQKEVGWQKYGGKHHESFFTRFYQTYILPTKFGIDKRRAHFSSLILSGQLERSDAIRKLEEPPFAPAAIGADIEYCLKKLGLERNEFDELMRLRPRAHLEFASEASYMRRLVTAKRLWRRLLGQEPSGT